MKKLTAALLAVVIGFSILFIGSSAIQAAPSSAPAGQIVPKTKHISHKVYRKGRHVTKTTWHHTKRYSGKTWRKSNHIGHKVGRKTKHVVMGNKHRTP